MNKRNGNWKKRSLVISSLLLVLAIALFGTYKYVRTQHRKHYHPLETQEVFPGVYTIRDDYVNAWFIRSDCGLVAMDTAMHAGTIRREMAKLNLRPEEVRAVFLSHTDVEHAGELKVFPNAKVYMAREEVQMVDGTTYRVPVLFMKNSISVPYVTLVDGQVMDLCGVKIRCILTPGHTPGSMSYVVNDTLLFGGDTLNMRNGRIEVLDKGFVNMDLDTMMKSITRLSKLTGIRYVLTLHFGYAEFQKAFENWREQ
ncbi:MAG: MBL fold metallo-hydrolase [Spirochaetes bacterium]|nr:MBL fold metallo-hydrolase [Spirochaetota bacterium]